MSFSRQYSVFILCRSVLHHQDQDFPLASAHDGWLWQQLVKLEDRYLPIILLNLTAKQMNFGKRQTGRFLTYIHIGASPESRLVPGRPFATVSPKMCQLIATRSHSCLVHVCTHTWSLCLVALCGLSVSVGSFLWATNRARGITVCMLPLSATVGNVYKKKKPRAMSPSA